ncbi:MAG: type II toxin-antitoxin system RelE/ParE family toxin [Planctomycetes bacterium]|nr:type II toxin-antitoxin system RelE/ParE family toxin [Planctomycetota bacterium]
MASYSVLVKRSAEKEIARLPEGVRRRVVERVLGLTDVPRPDVSRLDGSEKLTSDDKYRIRQGDRRVVYTIDDDARTVTVVRVGHRMDVRR